MPVRCKFVCSFIDKAQNNVYLNPVYSGSAENEQFFKATPGGQISFNTVNEAALAQFVVGKEYYVDFFRADFQPDVIPGEPKEGITSGPVSGTTPGGTTVPVPADGGFASQPLPVDIAANGFIGEPATFVELKKQIDAGWLTGSEAEAVAADLNTKANTNVYAVSLRAKDLRYTLYQINGQGIGGMGAGDKHVWADTRTFTPPVDTVERGPDANDASVTGRRS